MAALFKRPRPGGGRHPPALAPTISSFKPRAQWTNSGSSIFLYVNLPGFYRDQIEIKKDERARTVQIQGQRPLSTQTKARFNETYRVPDTCDMTELTTSFSHGLLTIEFPAIVEGKKNEEAVQDQRKIGQRSNQEKSSPNGTTLGQKKTLNEEKQVGTSQEKVAPRLNEEEPKTYKSVVEGKRVVPEKHEPKVKAREATPSLGAKERVKEETVVKRKEAAEMGQQKTGLKLKEEEARSTPTLGGGLKLKERTKEQKVVERKNTAQIDQQKIGQKLKEEEAKSTPNLGSSLKSNVRAKEEKLTERKKDDDISQNKIGEKVKEKESSRTPTIDASLETNVHAKVVEKREDGEIGQKLKEEVTINLGQKEQEKYTEPVVGDEAKITEKKIAAANQVEPELKTKMGNERTELDVDDGLRSKQDEKNGMVRDMVSEGEIQERVEQKKIEEAGLAKGTRDHNDNTKVVKPETGPLLVEEGQMKTNMKPPEAGGKGMGEEESRTYDISLVNVGAAALVIMGFGAYVFVPLVKYFS